MVYGAMAVSGYVDEKGISGYLPEAFGPDHKFYQTLLHEKMMAAVGQAFVNQFSHRTSYLNPYDKIILLPDSYHCMTPELADQLPQDLSYTSPAGLAAKIPLIGIHLYQIRKVARLLRRPQLLAMTIVRTPSMTSLKSTRIGRVHSVRKNRQFRIWRFRGHRCHDNSCAQWWCRNHCGLSPRPLFRDRSPP